MVDTQKIFTFFLLLATSISSSNLKAQQDFKTFLAEQNQQRTSFLQKERTFRQWFNLANITNTSGYKQYLRQSWFYQNRWHPTATKSANSLIYQQHSLERQPIAQTRNTTVNWQPIGPFNMAPSPQPYELRGIGRVNVVRFHPTDPTIFWVGTANGGIWKTENNGQSWIPLGDNLPVLRISDLAIHPTNPDIMYACLGDIYTAFVDINLLYPSSFGEGIYKSIDGGKTWQPTGLALGQELDQFSLLRRIVIHPDNPELIVAIGFTGAWYSTNGGENWVHLINNQILIDLETDPSNPNVLYATSVFSSTTVWKTTDFGQTWNALDLGLPNDGSIVRMEVAVAPSNPNTIYVLAAAYTGGLAGVYQSKDAGLNWVEKTTIETGPNILASLNGDPEFQESEAFGQGEYDLALMVNPHDENLIYTGGINVWGSPDGGENWGIISFAQKWFGPTIHQDIHHISRNPLDGKYYVCNDGGIDRTDSLQLGDINFALFNCLDFNTLSPLPDCYQLPTVWESLSDGLAITEFYRIGLHPSKPDEFMAGSQDNSVFYRQNGDFINIFDGDGMETIIDPLNTDNLYAGMELGRLEVSYDGGQTVIDQATADIYDDPTQLPGWVTPLVLHPQEANTLYIGFSDIWKSQDKGQNWEKVSSLPTVAPNEPGLPIRAFEISAANPQRMYLSRQPYFLEDNTILPNEFWTSEDGGTTWQNLSEGLPRTIAINDIAIHPTNPAILWVVCSHFSDGQKVFKSIDGGRNWENYSLNLPNFPVNSILHVGNGKNTLFIGMDRGVWYLDDEKGSWESFGIDLPNVIVNELAYDATTQQLFAATFGRGVWKADLSSILVSNNEIGYIEKELDIYPNPGQAQIHFSFPNLNDSKPFHISIIDAMGRLVLSAKLSEDHPTLNVSSIQNGLYYIQIEKVGFKTTRKWLSFKSH